MVEGFIVSLDLVFSYLVAHLAACSWEIPSLACSELGVRWDGGGYLERLVSGCGRSACRNAGRQAGPATQPQDTAAAALVVQIGRGRDRLLRLLGKSPLRPRPSAVETAAAVGLSV